jgi:hypothetical protein
MCGLQQSRISAEELAAAIRRRFPDADPSLEEDLRSCEDATRNEKIDPRAALKAIQTLHHHRQLLMETSRPGSKFGTNREPKDERP